MTFLGKKNLELNIKKIKFFISDIDGVMTDGNIFFYKGEIYRKFNVKDGLGIKLLKIAEIEPIILSSKSSFQSKERFASLGVSLYFEGIEKKYDFLEKFLKTNNMLWENVCYMGDDLPDLLLMKKSGFAICPSDAVDEVKKVADYICMKKGGEGAFREGVEELIKRMGKWEKVKGKRISMSF